MNEFEVVRHADVDGISLFFDTVEYRTAHMHSEWELLWIFDEPLEVTLGQIRHVVKRDDLVLFSPNEPHEFHRLENGCTFLCLQISPQILPESGNLRADGLNLEKYLTDEDLCQIKRILKEMAAAYFEKRDRFELLCTGLCSLIMYKLLTKLPCHLLTSQETASIDRRNARLSRLFQFVEENYMHKIRLADFAAAEGVSVSYLSHFIKDTMNQTFQEYVNSVRFHCACKLIAAGGMRMLDVCLASGFSDYRYFSRAFRQQFGTTPEQYSRAAALERAEQKQVSRSLHSIERFYSREESQKILSEYTK